MDLPSTKIQIGLGAAAIVVLVAAGIAGGTGAVLATSLIVVMLTAVVAGAVHVNRLTARAEQVKNNVTAPGGVPIAPVRPETLQVNHLLHLILTILTAGLWLLPWVVLSLSASGENRRMHRYYRAALRQYSADLAAYNGR